MRWPSEITFASLCSRARWADSTFQHRAQRIPLTRLATMASPFPGTAQNDAALILAARDSFGHGPDEQRIIHRRLRIGAEVTDFMPELLKKLPDLFLVLKAGVIGANRDFHIYSM